MSTTLEAQLDADPRALVEFEKIRFELAWRHFDLHARQRTTMFHFFILLMPFLFGGCFILFKEREAVGPLPAIVAAGAGALLALIFSGLDLRNKQLYSVSKEALGLIEGQFLFAPYRPLKISGSSSTNKISALIESSSFAQHPVSNAQPGRNPRQGQGNRL